MKCRSNDIQELLPAYQGRMLTPADMDRIEKHLSGCDDCTRELELLGILAAEQVPDPGEAFWTAMPGRIFREMQAQEQQKKSPWSPSGWRMPVIPRRAWAATAVLLVAAVVLLLDRPGPLDIARNALPENGSSYGDLLPVEGIDMAELTDSEIDSLDLWATEELALLRNELLDLLMNANDVSIDERLAELNEQELKRLSTKLDEYEEEG